MRVLTNEELNDPNFFNDPKFNKEKEASFKRAKSFYDAYRKEKFQKGRKH